MKNVLIISSSPRKKGNSQLLCEQFKKGAEEKGHQVKIVRILSGSIWVKKRFTTLYRLVWVRTLLKGLLVI